MAQDGQSTGSGAAAELIVELTAPAIEPSGGQRRVAAEVALSYHPGDGSPAVRSDPYRFSAPPAPFAGSEITWYLERYGGWPAGAFQERAERVEQLLPEWGRLLFEALVSAEGRSVLAAWEADEHSPRRFTVRVDPRPADGTDGDPAAIAAAARLLALPWELLNDDRGYLLRRASGVSVSRAVVGAAGAEFPATELPLRVLLLSPRPDDERAAFLDHRISARPLVEVLSQLGDLVRLTLLTPPTLTGLRDELGRARAAGQPYHVVHFDGLGIGGDEEESAPPRLCFEDPADVRRIAGRRTAIVTAPELAAALAEHRVPLLYLEAARPAIGPANPTAAIALDLLRHGVPAVAAMSFPVAGKTARRFVATFYRALLGGRRIGEAVAAGRRELEQDTCRGKVFTGELHLWDWFVPVLYQGDGDLALVTGVPEDEIEARLRQPAAPSLGELPPAPSHDFVGRSRELLAAERLLERAPYAVIQGERGEGKNSLAAELARWLVASQHFQRAAFVSLDLQADSRAVHLAIGRQLVPRFQVAASVDPGLAVQLVERVLTSQPTLLIFANLEAVLPPTEESPAAVAYEPKLLEQILTLCQRLGRIGRTRLIFTSQRPLPPPFDQHHVEIGRLDRVDAITLVGKVLADQGVPPLAGDPGDGDEELAQLVDAVRGHPRSLVLAADEVVESGVRGTAENLRAVVEPVYRKYPGQERRASALAAVELSLRRLDPATRRQIRPLGAFLGGGHLTAISTVLDLDIEKDEEVILADHLITVGLAEMLTQNYVRLHPALGPLLLAELSDEERETARATWAEAMVQLIGYLDQQQIKSPALASILTLLDLPNLLAVLDYLNQGADANRTIEVAAKVERLIEILDRPQALARAERVRLEATRRLGEWSHARFLAELAAVEHLLESGRHSDSAAAAKQLLERVEASGEHLEEGSLSDLAMAHLTLGRALLVGDKPEAALGPLNEARRRCQQLARSGEGNLRLVAVSNALAGDCLMALGHTDATAEAYERAIEVAARLGDRKQVAEVKVKVGMMHLELNRTEAALAAFTEARRFFEEAQDQETVAEIWHYVALVHERTSQYETAEQALMEALKIEVRADLRSAAAQTLAELGNLRDQLGRLEESVDGFRQAAELFVELKDLAREGIARSNVADKLMKLGRFDEAREELERAIECDKPFGHEAEPWKSFSLLAQLERRVGRDEAAREARDQALRAYLAYRRAGGENLTGHREIFAEVEQAVGQGTTDAAAAQLTAMQRRPDLPPQLKALLPVLQAVLTGSRDPALADDPTLYYRDAAELLLLLESLP